ncbi:YopX family protein [Brevibacillus brevis]|uniref:YopX protein domain-containing protein n=1 Tax=Brevibacillus brevis TaxID=1393 RepID=A0A517IAF3_BREBE|nr:YopX family protein [Brevibacillus brevis]QDS35855.1 hypothetical protein FPS98_18550 [Brevibacillus brevis]
MQAGREIKFRAWDRKQSKMVDMNHLRHHASGFRLLDEDREYEFMQYTGLCDKNGKEIYEGDILFWDGGFKVYTTVRFKDGMFLAGDMPLYDCVDEEVIGNIYENPELLAAKSIMEGTKK